MAVDFNTLTVPFSTLAGAREMWDPVNAWPGASPHVFVAVYRSNPIAMLQVGYDPATGRSWWRSLKEPGMIWTAWTALEGGASPSAPVPIDAQMINSERTAQIHFDLLLNSAAVPAPAAFVVRVKGVIKTVLTVTISQSNLWLNMDARYASGPISVDYTPPATNKLQSIDGVAVAAFLAFPVTAYYAQTDATEEGDSA